MGRMRVAVGLVGALLAGCGEGHDAELDASPRCEDPVGDCGIDYLYVIDSIVIPESEASALELGLDLDGDPLASPDNAVGRSLSVWIEQERVDVQGAADSHIEPEDKEGIEPAVS